MAFDSRLTVRSALVALLLSNTVTAEPLRYFPRDARVAAPGGAQDGGFAKLDASAAGRGDLLPCGPQFYYEKDVCLSHSVLYNNAN